MLLSAFYDLVKLTRNILEVGVKRRRLLMLRFHLPRFATQHL